MVMKDEEKRMLDTEVGGWWHLGEGADEVLADVHGHRHQLLRVRAHDLLRDNRLSLRIFLGISITILTCITLVKSSFSVSRMILSSSRVISLGMRMIRMQRKMRKKVMRRPKKIRMRMIRAMRLRPRLT